MPSPINPRRFVTPDALIQDPMDLGPHVVILGAGASRAAFLRGDANGKKIPIMNDLVEIVGLAPLLQSHAVRFESRNFEDLYADLCADPGQVSLRTELEDRIRRYFSVLQLPETATLYDRLLLSLREKDAVLTFNWDPFLFDAWERNRHLDPPPIYFLHGNVRARSCPDHPNRWGASGSCEQCGKPWQLTPLLYPVAEKNYDSNPFIRRHWQAALDMVREAFTVTVFGYGAPESDKAAVSLLKQAYFGRSDRKIGHFEVIDIQEPEVLRETWAPFVPTHHIHICTALSDSWMGRYPRRTCEGIFWPMTQGIPVESYQMPDLVELPDLQEWATAIREHEQRSTPPGR